MRAAVDAVATWLRSHRWAAALLSWLVGATVFFRTPIFSGFDTITGDRGDARLIVFLHEHWWLVWTGDAEWRSPPMFHPVDGTLGYSDTFIVNQAVYAPLRLLGADPFVSFQVGLIVLTLVGFASMFAILDRHLGLPPAPALLLSATAAFANNLYVDTGHPQLYSVQIIPAIVLLGLEAWVAESRRRRLLLSAAAGALLGLLLWSNFYFGWFAALVGGFVVLGGVAIGLALGAGRTIWAAVVERRDAIVVALAALGVMLVPFLVTYLPALEDSEPRSYDEVAGLAPRPADIVNVGGGNVVWGRLVGSLLDAERLGQLHRNVAVTPVLLVAALAAGIALARRLRHAPRPAPAVVGLACSLVAAFVVVLPIQFSFGGIWAWVHRFVPGGDAIRVYGRIEVVNVWVACAAIACWLAVRGRPGADADPDAAGDVADGGGAAPGDRRLATWRSVAPILLLGVIVAEQLNTTSLFRELDRGAELALVGDVAEPPAACPSFYVVDVEEPDIDYTNIDAILIAQEIGLPTVNGYSGLRPPGWWLQPELPTYEADAADWARTSGIAVPCAYDVVANRWIVTASR